jgi:hypothetical protein
MPEAVRGIPILKPSRNSPDPYFRRLPQNHADDNAAHQAEHRPCPIPIVEWPGPRIAVYCTVIARDREKLCHAIEQITLQSKIKHGPADCPT